MSKIVDVAVNLPVLKTFHYKVSVELEEDIEIGKRVKVPFGKKNFTGFIVGVLKKSHIYKLREITEVIDLEPVVSKSMFKLAKWISEYYICSLGTALSCVVSSSLKMPKKLKDIKSELKQEIASSLAAPRNDQEECFSERVIPAKAGIHEQKNEVVFKDKIIANKEKRVNLTQEQKKAVFAITKSLENKESEVFLLFGITGSGKTEVYMNIMQKVLDKGLSVIYLVPEISLTPQIYSVLSNRFNQEISVMHSKMTITEKNREWFKIKSGGSRIVIGPRSSVFAPVEKLGLIVVDEEHDPSYKQEDSPRHNARDVAVVRGKLENAKVILGSATPSLESFYNVSKGKYKKLELTDRVLGAELPEVSVIDMKYSPRVSYTISRVLFDNIINCLDKKEQIILFLNRRGSASLVLCKGCGYTVKCNRCDLSLTYHKKTNKLLCHYCGYKTDEIHKCPTCGKEVVYVGMGTQKLEQEINKLFPRAKIARLDSDSISKKGECERIFEEFENKKIDILVGTQILTKGLDFHNITLIGVISSDITLNIPDFRSQERTYQLLTQVSGRSGRGEKPGKVIIQSFNTEHYSIVCSARGSYNDFFEQELESRQILGYPPYSKMIEIILKGRNEKNVSNIAGNIYNKLKRYSLSNKNIGILGPSPMPIAYINKQHRWHILLKSKNYKIINQISRNILDSYKMKSGVNIFINVDPVNMI
jgi:primosomal protein N' (replication factor Y) (superfamily II helicase)